MEALPDSCQALLTMPYPERRPRALLPCPENSGRSSWTKGRFSHVPGLSRIGRPFVSRTLSSCHPGTERLVN